jgi:hypothetical protein
MIKELDLSDEERRALKGELQSDGWRVVAKVLDHVRDCLSFAYNNTGADHRYYQGKIHAFFEIQHALEQATVIPERPEPDEEEIHQQILGPTVGDAAAGDY